MKRTILDAWSKAVVDDRLALGAIAKGLPDSDLGPVLSAKVPRLVSRGWLQICEHSDGDYVRLTDQGRAILQKDNPAP